jgi:hypothetical protein
MCQAFRVILMTALRNHACDSVADAMSLSNHANNDAVDAVSYANDHAVIWLWHV